MFTMSPLLQHQTPNNANALGRLKATLGANKMIGDKYVL